MESQVPSRPSSSADPSVWIWIILAGLLILGVIVGIGSLGLMSLNQQTAAPTATPPAPATK